jgi:hypothetical protein
MPRPAPDIPPLLEWSPRTMVRQIISTALAAGGGDAADIARRLFPYDRQTAAWLERGVSTITSTTTTNAPTSAAVSGTISLLGPASSFAAILERCVNLVFGESSTIHLPSLTASGTGVAFTAQGAPFPIKQLATSAATLDLKKLGMGLVFTNELFRSSNAETILSQAIARDLSLGIEKLFFDATAADTTRPAGLKNGISALTADAGVGIDGMFADLSNLGATVSAVGGLNFCYICSPLQAIKVALRKSQNAFPFPVYASSALPDKQVCSLAFDALAVAGGDEAPRFELSKNAALHLEDTSPSQFSVSGSPNAISAPLVSTFQQDLVSVRVIQDISWVLRSTSGFAWINAVNW